MLPAFRCLSVVCFAGLHALSLTGRFWSVHSSIGVAILWPLQREDAACQLYFVAFVRSILHSTGGLTLWPRRFYKVLQAVSMQYCHGLFRMGELSRQDESIVD